LLFARHEFQPGVHQFAGAKLILIFRTTEAPQGGISAALQHASALPKEILFKRFRLVRSKGGNANLLAYVEELARNKFLNFREFKLDFSDNICYKVAVRFSIANIYVILKSFFFGDKRYDKETDRSSDHVVSASSGDGEL
jgi:hypothetical protein